MPPDIRNFFGPKGGSKIAPAKSVDIKKKSGRRGKNRTIIDSEDEEEEEEKEPKKTKTPPKPKPKPAPPPEEKVESTSSYFNSSGKNKVKRTEPLKTSRSSATAGKRTVVVPEERQKEVQYLDDDFDEDLADDIFKDAFGKNVDDYIEDEEPILSLLKPTSKPVQMPTPKTGRQIAKDEDVEMLDLDSEDDVKVKPKAAGAKKATVRSSRRRAASKKKAAHAYDDDEFVVPDDEDENEDENRKPTKRATTTTAGRKRKILLDEDEDELVVKPAKAAKIVATNTTPAKKTVAPRKGKGAEEEDPGIQAILDSVPTVKPPTPPPPEERKTFSYRDFKQRGAGPVPQAQGTKEIPEGAEGCLTGLTFVFTGVLDTISREDGQQLVKKYGGKVTTSPSTRTSYVVLGNEAGPKKLETIRQYKIKTINEDGLFHLIRTLPAHGGSGKAAVAAQAKRQAEEKKVQEMAQEMAKTMESKTKGEKGKAQANSDLWTVKYAPTDMSQICGNKGQVEKLQRWLVNWQKNHKIGFKKRGEDGSFAHRAVMIHGPPGVGKTTAAHLVAKLEGYDVVETNASDTRSKKLMEESLRGVLNNKSLMGYWGRGDQKAEYSKQKLLLIMDEVDGMSAGDRGGVGQLAAICKKTDIPIICICNERRLPKMRSFDRVTFDIQFRRPDAASIRSRIASIAYREGLKLPANVIDQLVEGTGSDIRQVINMLSTFSVSQKHMDFDESRALAKAWQKHVILKPWDITAQLLGQQMWAPNSGKTLNDKIELYFNDFEFSYLMIQENYLKTYPSLASNFLEEEQNAKRLELTEEAAESISDGDLVDALIHGPQQHWSLMPVHAILSTVTPASKIHGAGSGMYGFTSWLGNNSKQGKLARFLKEIQSHMRLRASGDRYEVRQEYLPVLWQELGRKLEIEGKEAIADVIDLMDSYYLTKEDFDNILELGVGPMDQEGLKIPPPVKSAFTKEYNSRSHPMPFIKATAIDAFSKGSKAGKKEMPDLEDVLEDDDEMVEEVDENQEAEDEEVDLSKDKYVKAKKAGAANKKGAGAAAGSSKGKANAQTKGKEKGKGKGKQ